MKKIILLLLLSTPIFSNEYSRPVELGTVMVTKELITDYFINYNVSFDKLNFNKKTNEVTGTYSFDNYYDHTPGISVKISFKEETSQEDENARYYSAKAKIKVVDLYSDKPQSTDDYIRNMKMTSYKFKFNLKEEIARSFRRADIMGLLPIEDKNKVLDFSFLNSKNLEIIFDK